MIDVNELNACLARKGFSKADGAKIVNVAPKTFYTWLREGSMPTKKAEMLINELEISNPAEIFFAGDLPLKQI